MLIDDKQSFNVGDIVKESPLITLPKEPSKVGIVSFIEEQSFGAYTPKIKYEDIIGVLWLDTGAIERIPASLLILIQSAKTDK